MKKLSAILFSSALAFTFAFGAPVGAYTKHVDKDCKDFRTWKQAQAYFEAHGGSKHYNFDGLDRDHDGLACEHLPGFDPHHKNPNDYKATHRRR